MSIYQKLNQSGQSIQNGWMLFFRTIAKQFKLKFVWGGSPRTDGNTIWLPRLPQDLNAEDMMLVKKHGYHEIGHCLFSDFGFFVDFGMKHGPMAQQLLNAIEDAWMEGKVARRVPVSKSYFREAPVVYLNRGQFRTGKDNMADALVGFILCKSHLVRNKWIEFAPPLEESRAHFERQFGEGASELLDFVEQIIESESNSCQTTEDNGKLTLRIIEALKQQADEHDKEDESDTEDAASDGISDDNDESDEVGDTESAGDDEDSSESGDNSDSGGDQDQGDSSGGGGNGAEDGNADADADADGEGDSPEPSISEKVEQLLNTEPSKGEVMDGTELLKALSEEIESGDHEEYSAKSLKAIPASGEFDPSAPSGGPGEGKNADGITELKHNQENAKMIKDLIGGKSMVLAGTLQQLLTSVEETETQIGRRGKLMGNKLYRIPMGNGKIFGTTEEVETDVAAISILADMSGSTHYNGCGDVLRQGLMLFNDVLSFIEADYEMLGFGSNTETDVSLIKGFNESTAAAAGRIGGMLDDDGGGTPLMSGLIEGSMRLANVDNHRKVMFVLTDGNPSNPEQCADYCNRLCQEGIEVVFLLMGQRITENWLETAGVPYVKAEAFDEVISGMMSQLTNILR